MDDATSSTYRYVDTNSLPFLLQLPPPSPPRHPAPPPPVARPPSINHNMGQAYNTVLGISHTNTHNHAFTPPRRISPPQHHRPSIEASYGHSKNAPHYHVQPHPTHKTPPPPSLSFTPPSAAFTSRQLPPLPDMAPNHFAPSSPRAHATGMPQRTNSLPAIYSHPSSSQPQASLPYSSPPHLMIRSYSDPFISTMATAHPPKSTGSGGPRFLPPFSKAFNAAPILATTTGTTEDWQPTPPITTRFTGTEVPAHEVALNVPAIVATRHERVKKQSTTKQLAALQRAAERRKLEAHLAHIQSQNQSQGQSQDQGQAQTQTGGWLSTSTQHGHPSASLMLANHHDHQQEQQASTNAGTNTTSASSSKAASTDSNATATAISSSSSPPPDLFPHQRHTKGRFASAPPPFDKDREPAYMRPRLQDEKFPGDLYTPAIVRAGKSCGIKGSGSGSVGSMGSKEAWCGLCLPHQVRSSTTSGGVAVRGSSLLGGWLNLRNSSYRYHMIRAHGISPKTCRPYAEPLETQRRKPGVDGKVGEGTELKGHCHQCHKWVVFGAVEPTNWWVHASKCHQEVLPDAEEVKGAMIKIESAAASSSSAATAAATSSLASITPFGPLTEVGSSGSGSRSNFLGAANLFASPSSSTRASSSGSGNGSKASPKKRARTTTTTTSSSTTAHNQLRPVLGQLTTLSHTNTTHNRPGPASANTTTSSSSRKRRAPPSFVSDDEYNYDGELDDEEEEAEADKGYDAKDGGDGCGVVEGDGPEPGWTISSSGRIIRLRDARWGNAV